MDNFCDNKIQFNKLFPLPPFKNNVLENTLNERTLEKQIGKLSAYTALIPLMPYDIDIKYFTADNIHGNFTGSLRASTGNVNVNVNIDATIYTEDKTLYLVYDFIECEVKVTDTLDTRYMVLWYIAIKNNKIDLGYSHNPYYDDVKIQKTLDDFNNELEEWFNEYNNTLNRINIKLENLTSRIVACEQVKGYADMEQYMTDMIQAKSDILKLKKTTSDLQTITPNKKWHNDFSNTIFIGDSFAEGYYYGSAGGGAENNWCVNLAKLMNITNYRRYAKSGLAMTDEQYDNSLYKFIDTTIFPSESTPDEKAPEKVTSIIIMMGENDSVLGTTNLGSNILETLNHLQEIFSNATIYLFYSAARNISEIASYRYYAEGCNSAAVCFIGESAFWNIGAGTDFYVKGGTDTTYHPTKEGSMRIAKQMRNYFSIGDICPRFTHYITAHTENENYKADVTGWISIENNMIIITGNCSINAKAGKKVNDGYIRFRTYTIPEYLNGNQTVITNAYDGAYSRAPAFIEFNTRNGSQEACILVFDRNFDTTSYDTYTFQYTQMYSIDEWVRL